MKIHGRYVGKFLIFCEDLFRVNSGLHSQFTKWPAVSVDRVLSCKLNGQGSNPTWTILKI